MADFDPPFASVGGVNRSPTTDEQSDGFQCGPADNTLFNRLFGRIEAELKSIQDAGGIAGNEGDDATVLKAILALIDAAIGTGDTAGYILFSQAQARLPIYPEVLTNSGVIAVSAVSTGTVRIPASASILHRGIQLYTSAETDLTTVASKTYHLRWSPVGGFVLKDLADVAYNPTAAAESNSAFDSSFDDMLVSRVVTNSSNVATITNLKNLSQMSFRESQEWANVRVAADSRERVGDWSFSYNWGRTPTLANFDLARRFSGHQTTDGDTSLYILPYGAAYNATKLDDWPFDRYGSKFAMLHDNLDINLYIVYVMSARA